MNNIRKEAIMKMKVTKVFKVIITSLLIIAFTVSVISCKGESVIEEPVVEEVTGEAEEETATVEEPTEEETLVEEDDNKGNAEINKKYFKR